MYVSLHTEKGVFLSDFNEICVSSTDFREILIYQISCKSKQWEQIVSCGGTDRRTDMTDLIVAFRNFANASQRRKTKRHR